MADLGLAGKGAQSNLVRALARWARAGWVTIDLAAPRNFPRYALTMAGRQAWEEAIEVAEARAAGFQLPPMHSKAQSLSKDTTRGEGSHGEEEEDQRLIKCPECGLRTPLGDLQEMLDATSKALCPGCWKELKSLIKKVKAL